MAIHHVARGKDLKTIQEALGHAKLDTTAIYVSLAKKAQRKALQEHALCSDMSCIRNIESKLCVSHQLRPHLNPTMLLVASGSSEFRQAG